VEKLLVRHGVLIRKHNHLNRYDIYLLFLS
jgi:hypothetical protein